MRRALEEQAPVSAVLCWICEERLDFETDGAGEVHAYCPTCRPRLAALEEVGGEVVRIARLVREPKPRRHRGGSPHDWPYAKLLYEQGMAQVAISRMLGIPIKTMYNKRSIEKWKRPQYGGRREGVTV